MFPEWIVRSFRGKWIEQNFVSFGKDFSLLNIRVVAEEKKYEIKFKVMFWQENTDKVWKCMAYDKYKDFGNCPMGPVS